MRNLIISCAVVTLVMLSARSEARPPELKALRSNAALAAKAQFGVASWYGPEFQGLPMASGQPFNMEGMTCAHRKLPLGTHVKVTNLLNGRKAELEVTDRGPFVGNRVLDVSMAAAKRLGFKGQGLIPVRIQVVSYPHPHTAIISQADPQTFTTLTN